MATLLGALSILIFLFGIAALIRPIPKLKVRTRANALLVIAASFGIALLSGLFVEADSGGVSSDVKLAQGGEAPIPDYEFVSRAEYVGGMGVKVRVPGGLSKEEVGHVIGDAANRYGGNEEDTVWVYREGDDVTLSGYTVAMGERPNRRAKFELAFSDAYFADKTDSSEAQPTEEINVQPVEKDTEVASPNAETERKARLASKTKRMAESIAATLREHYKIEPEPLIPDMALCRDDGYCDFMAGDFQLQVYGAGIAEVLTSTQFPHRDYRKMCVAVFSAISGSNIDLSAELIEGAFVKASQSGPIQSKVANTQIEIEPSWDGLLACSFFKYGN